MVYFYNKVRKVKGGFILSTRMGGNIMDEKREFSITITGFECNTWQGDFACDGFNAPFLSELDLIHLMEDQLNVCPPGTRKTQDTEE